MAKPMIFSAEKNSQSKMAEPLSLWFISRVLCIAMIYLGAAFSQEGIHGLSPLFRWDTFHYMAIATQGYATMKSTAFFPLYPLMIRFIAKIGITPFVAGLLLSNAAMLAASIILYRLADKRFGTAAARLTLTLWLFYPWSLYGNVPYTESWMALFFLLSLIMISKERYPLSGLWMGICSALRPQGILLSLSLTKETLRRPWSLIWLTVILSGVGLVSYMLFLYINFGNPTSFVEAQKYWRPIEQGWHWPLDWVSMIANGMINMTTSVFKGDFGGLRANIGIPFMLGGLMLLPQVMRTWGWNIALVCLVMWALPLATGSLSSIGRFTWPIMPIFLAAGQRFQDSRWGLVFVGLFVAGLVGRSFLFGYVG